MSIIIPQELVTDFNFKELVNGYFYGGFGLSHDEAIEKALSEYPAKPEPAAPGFYLNQAVPQKVVAQILHDMHGKTGPVKLVDGNKVINDIIKQIKCTDECPVCDGAYDREGSYCPHCAHKGEKK